MLAIKVVNWPYDRKYGYRQGGNGYERSTNYSDSATTKIGAGNLGRVTKAAITMPVDRVFRRPIVVLG